MPRIYAAKELEWKGDRLVVQGGGRHPSVEVISDAQWPSMWRVKRPDGGVTDMVNRSATAARSILLAVLNSQETCISAPPIQFEAEDAPEPAFTE